MITHLSIKDFAIIEEISLDFHQGFNILTGETGAGKSIIIEAINMALGSRADTSFVRSGKEKAIINLAIEWEDPEIALLLTEAGIEAESPLIIAREISASGKSLCRINGQLAPLSFLNRLCKRLVDIHGQYDHQSLLNPENHLQLLDLYGGTALGQEKAAVATLYEQFAATKRELRQLREHLAEGQRQKDFMSFELQEIRSAKLVPGEDEELRRRLTLLQNSERIHQELSMAYELIFGQSAAGQLQKALSVLQEIQELSPDISRLTTQLADCCYSLEDLGPALRKCREGTDFSPAELEETLERLDLIDKLKRKHGRSPEEILVYAEELEQQIENMIHADQRTEELATRAKLLEEQLASACRRLSKLRKNNAAQVARQVGAQLRELNFKDAALSATFTEEEYAANGSDRMEFLIVTNKGETPKPLSKIASGGEISRIMLAFKCIMGQTDHIPTLIFDEIDSGISGATASIVGQKLIEVSREHQILCVTHLPQIAACGDHHYKINKVDKGNATLTTIVPLSPEEKVREIARLLGGVEISDAALRNAEDLIHRSALLRQA